VSYRLFIAIPTWLLIILIHSAYGISIVQVYLYFRNYPKDSLFLKLTVIAIRLAIARI
jgi:hypothetical protein